MKPRRQLGSWALVLGLAFTAALALASACSNSTAPPYVPSGNDSTLDSLHQGFLVVPPTDGDLLA